MAQLEDRSAMTGAEQRQALLAEAKRINSEFEAALAERKKIMVSGRCDSLTTTDPLQQGTTTISAAALLSLPESVTNERRQRLTEVSVFCLSDVDDMLRGCLCVLA